jgi:membrane protein DedA with SNARE-associated domain
MFSEYIGMSLFVLMGIIAGLVLSYWIGRMVK